MCTNGTGQVGCGPQEEFRACADVAIIDSSGEADETPYIPNEIDDTEVSTETDTGEKPEGEDYSGWWFLLIVIIVATLFLVLVTFLFVYFYFYKKEKVKEWWEQKQLPVFHSAPKKSQFWKNFKEGNNRLAFWKTNDDDDPKKVNEKSKNYVIPQPVPPPRTKRNNNNKSTEEQPET